MNVANRDPIPSFQSPHMKAKVIALHKTPTTVNGVPVKVGDTVSVDECTFRNLAKKGVLEAADAESKAVSLEDRSVLTEEDAKDSIAEQVHAKKEKKAAEDAAKEAKDK